MIEKLEWPRNEWPIKQSGDRLTRLEFEYGDAKSRDIKAFEQLDFENEKLNLQYQSLRTSISSDWLRYSEGSLYLKGRKNLNSLGSQSLVARRVQSFSSSYSVIMSFIPDNDSQSAGLVCYI